MRHSLFRLWTVVATLTICSLVLGGCSVSVGRAQPVGPGVVFVDEFDGPAGLVPSSRWRVDTGGGGWGNNEVQTYTDDPGNVSLDGAGHLAISARADERGAITSARISTKSTMEFTFGRAEARIALPAGAGLHPAFWLLGADVDAVGWPEAGEIDVIETLNAADQFHTGVHAPSAGSARGQEISAAGVPPSPLPGVFHTYWVARSPGLIQTGIDESTLLTVTPADLAPTSRWVFDAPFFLLLNVAVGGNWPGPPDASTPNPSTMLVDWVKVSTQ